MNGLHVIREVSGLPADVTFTLARLGQIFEYQEHRGNSQKGFGPTWVKNDAPHDDEITRAIMLASTGMFRISDEDGGWIDGAGPWADLAKAERAKAGAKISFVAEVEVEDDEPDAPFPSDDAAQTSAAATWPTTS